MDSFPTIDEIYDMLEDISEEIPTSFYKELSGGIILEEDIKYHPESRDERPLYVLGEYRNFNIGRSIVIYYGSFKKSYAYERHDHIYEKLREAVIHEFTHHLESLAGKDDLRMEDKSLLKDYRSNFFDRGE